jgi:hypothetical protein
MKKALVYSTFMSVALLSGCSEMFTFTEIQQVRPFKVQLTVNGGKLTNDKGPNTKCKAFANSLKKGCFFADIDEVLELEFKLKKRAEGANWRFTKLMICAGTEKPTDSSKCYLNATQQAEWLVMAEMQLALMPPNGTVDLTGFSDTLWVFTVVDINAHEGDYVYNIQACKEGSLLPADCVWMDPGGSNRGR